MLAMLSWIAAVLCEKRSFSARHLRQRGDMSFPLLSRWVGNLLIAHALHVLPRTPRARFLYWRRTFNARPSQFRRSLLGAKLRRVLTHKDPATRVAQLIAVLRNIEEYAVRLAYRIRHCLRRVLRGLLTIAPATPRPAHGACILPAFSDSS
jgi:hypothetical protein